MPSEVTAACSEGMEATAEREDTLAAMEAKGSKLVKFERIIRAETQDRLPVKHGIGLRSLDQLTRIGRELPFDPARLSAILVGFLFRPRDQGEQESRLLSAPRFIIHSKQGAMELLKHVADPLVTLVASAYIGFANAMRTIFPCVSTCGQDHERQQPRCRTTR